LFVADHLGCFLTYPTFTIRVDDSKDCTIPCAAVDPNTEFDFDSRLHLQAHSTCQEIRRCCTLRLRKLHQARLVTLRKSHAHLRPTNNESLELIPTGSPSILKEVSATPIRPVYLVPNSGCAAIQRISSHNLKRMNQEDRIWSKSEKFAPVMRGESSRVMTLMAVQAGQKEKQGDCKNTFCQSYLPKDEKIIVPSERMSAEQTGRTLVAQENIIRPPQEPIPLVPVNQEDLLVNGTYHESPRSLRFLRQIA
jgi:hypothetical protein